MQMSMTVSNHYHLYGDRRQIEKLKELRNISPDKRYYVAWGAGEYNPSTKCLLKNISSAEGDALSLSSFWEESDLYWNGNEGPSFDVLGAIRDLIEKEYPMVGFFYKYVREAPLNGCGVIIKPIGQDEIRSFKDDVAFQKKYEDLFKELSQEESHTFYSRIAFLEPFLSNPNFGPEDREFVELAYYMEQERECWELEELEEEVRQARLRHYLATHE
jgi:hypothetical protein